MKSTSKVVVDSGSSPSANQHGLLATFFLTANTEPIHIDRCEHPAWRKIEWNEGDIQYLQALAHRGHEIGSHSVWHKITNPNDPRYRPDFDPKFEAEESKRLIEKWMGIKILSFCYPFCQKPDPVKNAVIAAEYKQARTGSNATYYPLQGSIDWFDIDCRLVSEGENIGRWVRPHHWHVLMFHGIGTIQDGWGPISVPEFTTQMTELAKLRDSGAVEIVTFKDGADRLRQPK